MLEKKGKIVADNSLQFNSRNGGPIRPAGDLHRFLGLHGLSPGASAKLRRFPKKMGFGRHAFGIG